MITQTDKIFIEEDLSVNGHDEKNNLEFEEGELEMLEDLFPEEEDGKDQNL